MTPDEIIEDETKKLLDVQAANEGISNQTDPWAFRLGARGATLGFADEIEAGLKTGFGLAGDYD